MTSEAVQSPPPETREDPTLELREHLVFQRAEARVLRERCATLAHELALTRRLLASFLPAEAGERPPETTAAVRLPALEFADAEGDLRFCVDDVERGTACTRLRGWAFAPGLNDCGQTRITLLFVPMDDVPPAGPHVAVTDPRDRPDVAAAFAGLSPAPAHLARAGFMATVFHPSISPGDYELLLHAEQPGVGAARAATGVRLRF